MSNPSRKSFPVYKNLPDGNDVMINVIIIRVHWDDWDKVSDIFSRKNMYFRVHYPERQRSTQVKIECDYRIAEFLEKWGYI